jgi:hypothetical protein
MERDLARVSEPWNAIRPDEIADYPSESRHAEDGEGEQGGADCSVLLQERSVDGLQPLLHVGPMAMFEFHGAPFWGSPTILAPA